MGISWVQLLIILVIVILLFGTKKLRSLGSDLGGSLREFKKAVKDEDKTGEDDESPEEAGGQTFDATPVEKDKDKS